MFNLHVLGSIARHNTMNGVFNMAFMKQRFITLQARYLLKYNPMSSNLLWLA